jgi:hypothetical protein
MSIVLTRKHRNTRVHRRRRKWINNAESEPSIVSSDSQLFTSERQSRGLLLLATSSLGSPLVLRRGYEWQGNLPPGRV